jgi:hypothetical protein
VSTETIALSILDDIQDRVLLPGAPVAGPEDLARQTGSPVADAQEALDVLVATYHIEPTGDGYQVAADPGADPTLAPSKRRGRRVPPGGLASQPARLLGSRYSVHSRLRHFSSGSHWSESTVEPASDQPTSRTLPQEGHGVGR